MMTILLTVLAVGLLIAVCLIAAVLVFGIMLGWGLLVGFCLIIDACLYCMWLPIKAVIDKRARSRVAMRLSNALDRRRHDRLPTAT
jgi:hypothetical protein